MIEDDNGRVFVLGLQQRCNRPDHNAGCGNEDVAAVEVELFGDQVCEAFEGRGLIVVRDIRGQEKIAAHVGGQTAAQLGALGGQCIDSRPAHSFPFLKPWLNWGLYSFENTGSSRWPGRIRKTACL